MKLTDRNIADFYGVTRMTIHNYKNGDVQKKRLYEAMKRYFLESQKPSKD